MQTAQTSHTHPSRSSSLALANLTLRMVTVTWLCTFQGLASPLQARPSGPRLMMCTAMMMPPAKKACRRCLTGAQTTLAVMQRRALSAAWQTE
jgi:hypothetical protein